MSYDSTNKTISTPVSISDMQKALGRYNYSDIGGLTTYGDVNIWSKCKPFRHLKLYFADEDERATARYNANCGLAITSYSTLWSLLDALKNKTVGELVWTYLKPGGDYPFRFGDFIGYQGTDKNPIVEYGLTGTSKYYEDVIGVVNKTKIHHPTLCLKLTDMKTTDELVTECGEDEPYIGIIYCNENNISGSTFKAITTDNLDNNDWIIPENTLTAGANYIVAFFYSSISIGNSTNLVTATGKFIPIPIPICKFSVNSEFGILWRSTSLEGIYTVNPTINGGNANGERMLDILSFHVRKSGNYSTNGGGLYTITASADSSGSEEDKVIFTNTTLGQNIKYVSHDGYSSESGSAVKQTIHFAFSVDTTAEGVMTFVKYRHLTLVGSRWHQVTVVTPFAARSQGAAELSEE